MFETGRSAPRGRETAPRGGVLRFTGPREPALLRRARMRDHTALRAIDAALGEELDRGIVLRTFCHSLHQEGLCEVYHRRHDVAAGGLLRQITNELPVDLEIGDW